jgi:hypothetical protein
MNDRFAEKCGTFFPMFLEVNNFGINALLIDLSKEMIIRAIYPFPPSCQVAILS